MNRSESIVELTKSLVAFQAEVMDPTKNAQNDFNKAKYATLDALLGAVRPVLSKHNLAFVQSTVHEGDYIYITTLLMHISGECLESSPLRVRVVKDDPQGVGSAITYARRYSLSAFLGIASSDDDDGQINDEQDITRHMLKELNDLVKMKGIPPSKVSDYIKASFGKNLSNQLDTLEIDQLMDWVKAQ